MSVVDFGTTNPRCSGTDENYTTNKAGAELLKLRIEAYWRERGHVVQVVLEEKAFNETARGCRWDIRSNLCNGLPQKSEKSA